MELPKSNNTYALKEYWDTRYKQEETFDWFAKYDTFKSHIYKTIKQSDRILNLGLIWLICIL